MKKQKETIIQAGVMLPFMLVTCLFGLWGFANDITNPLVKAFKDVFVISNTQSSFVQMAFYGGYATMALPAALFIRRFSYKSGIILGLTLYATGALLSIPAASMVNFNLFLVALYVLTFGLAFLETTANPYILSMGSEKTATRRLNLAQAFNPIGSLAGMTVAIFAILSSLQVQHVRNDVAQYTAEATVMEQVDDDAVPVVESSGGVVDRLMAFLKLDLDDGLPVDDNVKNWMGQQEDLSGDVTTKVLAAYKAGEIATFRGKPHAQMQQEDLAVVKAPYVAIGIVVIVFLVLFLVIKMPDTSDKDEQLPLGATFKQLLKNRRYLEGAFTQAFYVGAQIMVWTFIIHYATDLLGFTFAKAQTYNVIAMIIFCFGRFICTFLLKYFSSGHLLMSLALGALTLTLGAIFLQGMAGLYCLVGISACMALMFPTIYGIALDGMGEEAKVASAGLIFAIVGGCFMPTLQGRIIDMGGVGSLEGVRVSFVLPLICFVVVAMYGYRTFKVHHPASEDM